MIEAIKRIGEYAVEKEGKSLEEPLSIIVENPATSEAYKHVLAIKINKIAGKFEFGGIGKRTYNENDNSMAS